MDTTPTDWKDLDHRILSEVNIQSAYETAGLRISSKGKPSASGWLPCHAIGRPDKNPSAAINVGDGTLRGRYKDHGSGESLSLWDALVKLGFARDWKQARSELASKTSVTLNGSHGDKRPAEFFSFAPLSMGTAMRFEKRKAGVSKESLYRAGGMFATWPERSKMEDRQCLIAFPCWGPDLLNDDPTGYHCCGDCCQPVKIYTGHSKGENPKPQYNESKTMQKGPTGLINDWAVRHWHDATVVWVVEGLTDMLCVQSLLGNRTDHVVVTMGGCSKTPSPDMAALFKGKDVRVLFDSDPPTKDFPTGAGHAGSVRFVTAIAEFAKVLRNVRLPYSQLKSKKDVRDWATEDGQRSYEDLTRLAEQFSPLNKAKLNSEIAKTRQKGVIANATIVPLEGGGVRTEPLPFGEIIGQVRAATEGWPKKCAGQLFVDFGAERGKDRIKAISSAHDLFGFFHQSAARVDWKAGSGCITKFEFYAALMQEPDDFETFSEVPHFPDPIPSIYYAIEPIDESAGDGSALEEFLDFFPASTNIDRQLLQAFLMTMFWSGPPGSRPAFLITTTKQTGMGGTGSGKTTTATYLSELAGGMNMFSRCENAEKISTRLLTGQNVNKRVLMLDNIKTEKFAWSDLESLMTTREISGKRLYKGNAAVPNYFTWALTLNNPSLGTDIANRSIPIELTRPEYSSDWNSRVATFVRDRGPQVIGDLAAIFAGERNPLENTIRWGEWAKGVLALLPNPQECHDTIVARQAEFNTDSEDTADVLQLIIEKLLAAGINPVKYPAFIPSKRLCQWLAEEFEEKFTRHSVSAMIRRESTEGRMPNIERYRHKHRRGYIFYLKALRGNENWGHWVGNPEVVRGIDDGWFEAITPGSGEHDEVLNYASSLIGWDVNVKK